MVDGQKPKRLIPWSDICQHKTPENAWIVIHHKVYDVSGWDTHPGGHIVFTQAGEDATDAFAVFHPSSALKLLEPFYIGEVDETTRDQIEDEPLTEVEQAAKQRATEFITAYRKLRLQIKSMGLYKANPLYYLWKLVSTFAIALVSVYLCYIGQSLAIYLVAGAIMGLFYQQSGWLAHDFLHHQVAENRLIGDCFGILVGNVWQGFSVQWWKNKHNTHHAVPNLHGRQGEGFSGDPDIDTMPLLAWSKEMAQRATESTIGPFFIRHQAILYFPLLLFARLSWLVQSGMYVFQQYAFYAHDPVQHLRLEQMGLMLYYGWNIVLPYVCGMSMLEGMAFFLTSQATCGLLLALVFSLGHNGMAVYEREEKPDFWKLQVTTTRNITSSYFMDWFTGGLNYQIDHHLFPMIPRHNLHKLNILVKSLCKEFEIPYHETSFYQGLKEVLNHLGTISKEFITEFPAM